MHGEHASHCTIPAYADRTSGTPVAVNRLKRSLGLWDLIIIGIVIIQPIAPMGVYGVISNKAGGHVITTILIAMVAMLFTAISYGRMAKVYPSAGLGLPLCWPGDSSFPRIHHRLEHGDGLHPEPPDLHYHLQQAHAEHPSRSSLLVPGCFLRGNVLGTESAWRRDFARINDVLAAGMMIVVIIFLAVVFRYVYGLSHYGPGFFTQPFYNPETFNSSRIFQGTSIAVLTYIGFDGISTLSEEVENPRRNILLATVLVCVITGVLSGLEVYAAQLVWGSKPFAENMVESAFPLVARQVGGIVMFHLLNFTILIANIGSGMGAQLAAARLLYGMGRNDALPKKIFGAIEPRRHIPRNNVIVIGAIALAGAFLLEFLSRHGGEGAYATGTQLLNFGAVIAFMGVNAAAFIRFFVKGQKTIANLLPPVLGFLFCFAIWLNLSRTALKAGVIWLIVGIVYGAIKTKNFRNTMRFEEAAE